jgi:hypothetical protein
VEQDTAVERHELLLTETGGVVTLEEVDVVGEELVEGQPAMEEYEVAQDVSNPLLPLPKVEQDTAVETQELLLTETGGVVTLEEELVEHGPRVDVEQVVSSCLLAFGILWYVVVQAISRLIPLIHVGVGVGVGVLDVGVGVLDVLLVHIPILVVEQYVVLACCLFAFIITGSVVQ